MKISDKLADLNHKRYVEWRTNQLRAKHAQRLWPLREMSIKASKRKVSMTTTLNSRRDTCAFYPALRVTASFGRDSAIPAGNGNQIENKQGSKSV